MLKVEIVFVFSAEQPVRNWSMKFAKSSSTVPWVSHVALRRNNVVNVSEQEYIEFRTVPGHQYPICKVLVAIYRFFFFT